jgi:hypothetical protein
VSYGYRDEQRRATRVEIKRDRCFWRVVLITELIGDGQPVDFGLHTSRSVAEDLAGKMRALFLCAEPPEGLPEEVRIRDDIATCERELALYDQTCASGASSSTPRSAPRLPATSSRSSSTWSPRTARCAKS